MHGMGVMGIGGLMQKELDMGREGQSQMPRLSETESSLFLSDPIIFEALCIDAITDFWIRM